MTDKELVAAIINSESTYSVGDVARFAQQLGVSMGRTRLYEWMRDRGYLCKTDGDWNLPTNDFMEAGYAREVIDFECADGQLRNVTRITGKGLYHLLSELDMEFRIEPAVSESDGMGEVG